MMKLIINPAYKRANGEPLCEHSKSTVRDGNRIYIFCDVCMKYWVR